MRTTFISGICLVVLVGCGGENSGTPPNNSELGGQSSAATTAGLTGGASSAAGGTVSQTGGAKATGGSAAETGGATNGSTGGKATGGATSASTGGKATGGTTSASTGGKATGGTTSASTGGKATGGNTSVSTGGAAPGGNTSVSTGGKATGGNTSVSTGGKATGGNTSVNTGGAATGGATNAGGQPSFKCENLSMAAKQTNTDKPTGAAGGLKVLDWAGFKGAVSFTFDDNMTTGSYSKFKATGAHVTLFVTSAMSNYQGYTGAPAAGDEIGNHSSTHAQSGNSSAFDAMQTTIKSSYGVTPFVGAAPYGDSSWITPAKSFFIADRGVSNSDISPRTATESLLFNLPAYLPNTGDKAATMNGQLKAGKWKVFCVHGWASPAYNPIDESEMISTMTKAVSDGYWAETMGHVAAYFIGQNAISASATTSATWTLPAHFPPNMCVRITTSGGTVTQKGAEVPWDPNGYYQISLDAGEVTIK